MKLSIESSFVNPRKSVRDKHKLSDASQRMRVWQQIAPKKVDGFVDDIVAIDFEDDDDE